jgi:hypothetical protein
MKKSNYQTPRNLAECQFDVGYMESKYYQEPLFEKFLGYVLAIVIGVGMAVLLVAWWSS